MSPRGGAVGCAPAKLGAASARPTGQARGGRAAPSREPGRGAVSPAKRCTLPPAPPGAPAAPRPRRHCTNGAPRRGSEHCQQRQGTSGSAGITGTAAARPAPHAARASTATSARTPAAPGSPRPQLHSPGKRGANTACPPAAGNATASSAGAPACTEIAGAPAAPGSPEPQRHGPPGERERAPPPAPGHQQHPNRRGTSSAGITGTAAARLRETGSAGRQRVQLHLLQPPRAHPCRQVRVLRLAAPVCR